MKKEHSRMAEDESRNTDVEKLRSKKDEEESYDESEDEDYDPSKKVEAEAASESDDSESGKVPDYSKIEAGVSDVKTRSQRYASRGRPQAKSGYSAMAETGLVKEVQTDVDIDAIFNSLKSDSGRDGEREWRNNREENGPTSSRKIAPEPVQASEPAKSENSMETKKVKIASSYVFAGKVITEQRLVDADSAVAKAYLNSTNAIASANAAASGRTHKSSIPVIREVPGFPQPLELRIKLKRPSLIDKFLSASDNKKFKLSTLEKSRLDWASFVDSREIKDELALGNKDGYLEKQDFLGRVQHKRDEQYQIAQVKERERQWKLQQSQQ